MSAEGATQQPRPTHGHASRESTIKAPTILPTQATYCTLEGAPIPSTTNQLINSTNQPNPALTDQPHSLHTSH
jgi:hypothetical protein